MAEQDFELPSGAKLHVSTSDFQDAKALTKAIVKATSGIQLASNPMDMDVTIIKDLLVAAVTSDEIEAALFKCLARSTWNNIKVTSAIFDDPQFGEMARADYFIMCAKVVEVNCKPFFDQALSTLKTFLQKKNVSLASQ